MDLSRLTARERALFAQGLAEGKAAGGAAGKVAVVNGTTAPATGWATSEFWLVATVVAFTIWAGYRAIVDVTLDMDRVLAVTGMVSALAYGYTSQRSSVKKAAIRTAGAEG